MAQKQFGGYYPNPDQGGKVMRWWGGNSWTMGEDPTGGRGPNWQGGGTPATQQPAATQASQPSGDLWSQYQPQLAGATQQSNKLLEDYYAMAAQAPTFQQKLIDAIKSAGQYPNQAAMREEYAQNPNLTPMAIEALVSQRGMSTRGSIQDVINRATGGLQSEISGMQGAAQQAQQQRGNLLEEYGLEYQSQQNALDRIRQAEQDRLAAQRAGKATQWETQQGSRSKMLEQAGKGATLPQLVQEFGSSMDIADIVKLYTGTGFYGAPEEPWARDILGMGETGLDQEAISAYVRMINERKATISNVPKEYRDAVSIQLGSETSEEEGKKPGTIEKIRNILKSF